MTIPIDVSNCLVRGFSLSEYRSEFNLNQNEKIELIDFCANDVLFESEKVVDFSLESLQNQSRFYKHTLWFWKS